MYHYEINIGVDYLSIKFHSTADDRQMQKNITPCQESFQTEIL